MSGRSAASTRRLLELVGEPYGFEDLDEFRPGILEVLNRAVPSLWVSYNEVGLDPDKVYSLVLPPAPEDLFPRLRAPSRIRTRSSPSTGAPATAGRAGSPT
jgi:hypothetical protein